MARIELVMMVVLTGFAGPLLAGEAARPAGNTPTTAEILAA